MLWSLIKIVLFVALVAAVAFGAAVLLEIEGGLRLVVSDIELTLAPLQLAILAGLTLLTVWLVLKLLGLVLALLRFISGDETAVSRYFSRSRERRGYRALADGMVALASGEGRLALNRAARAEKYLGQPGLTDLLVAQAAELAGDGPRATQAYKRLLSDDKTRFVGLRGLMRQKIAAGDRETALKLAEKALMLNPRPAETQDVLLELQAGQADWAGARKTLLAKMRAGSLPRDVHRRRDAVLALQEARGLLDEGADIEAREAVIAANKQSPDLIPAATMAARSYTDRGDTKHATRLLRKAWEAQPHPDLAAAFAEIVPEETPTQRLRRFEPLFRAQPDHPETQLLRAELEISAEDFPAARKAMGDLAERHPTQRALTIMAAIDRGMGAPDAVVRGWLTRALGASRGPQWVCDKCQLPHAHWAPVCEGCGGFDTLSWREPSPRTTETGPTGTELLPLIVGAPDAEPDVSDETPNTASNRQSVL